MPNRHTIFLQRTLKLENAFQPKLIRIIKNFREQFISDLQSHGKNTAIGNLQQRVIADKLAPLIQTIYKTAGLVGAKMVAEEIQASAKKEQKAAGFGRNERWIRDVLDYLKLHMVNLIQEITDTMREDIVNILQKGIDDNLTIPEIVANLRRANLIESRAKVIARTEIIRAANVGHSVAAKSSPYEVNKKWSAAKDHRTRHSHQKVNGNIVDENDFFTVAIYKGDKQIGTEPMLYPGDASATPGNTINCRCRVLYEPKRDSAGNLIMRDRTQAPVIPMRRVPTYEIPQIAAILKSQIKITTE